jgi:hypothetical protein
LGDDLAAPLCVEREDALRDYAAVSTEQFSSYSAPL